MLLLRPKISESQFAELAKMQKRTVNHWCLSRPNYPISSGRWKILTVWLSHLTKVPPGAGETFPCCLQTQTFPCGYMSGTEMSCAATYMNTGLVFVKGDALTNMPLHLLRGYTICHLSWHSCCLMTILASFMLQ